MPRQSSMLVLDEFVVGTSAVYTSPEYNDLMGQPERFALQVVTDQVTVSGGTPQIEVRQEHSSDQRNWSNKNGSAEVPSTNISTTATTNLVGYEAGTNPSHGYVRLKVTLTSGTSPQAHVKIWFTGRDLT